jgi:hypothetical protein
MKPLLIFQGPHFTRSGYGDRSRDILRVLKDADVYDVKIIPMRWGNTPQNQVDPTDEFGKWMLERVINSPPVQPDVFLQLSVANEFKPIGRFNVGITAGTESSLAPVEFIQGVNRMDLTLVSSTFTKLVLEGTEYKDPSTGVIVKVEKPIRVMFEGIDMSIFGTPGVKIPTLDAIPENFCFLFVGHWLKGTIGEDRKNVGMLVRTFVNTFNTLPPKQRPALILKTSSATFSTIDVKVMQDKIRDAIGDCTNPPNVYLIHGDMTPQEMSTLYHHSKVKAMVSFTKGEGFGRPLLEFTPTGKPILVSGWSGHMDFLPDAYTDFLLGDLTHVHPSAADKFNTEDAHWFTVQYSNAAKVMKSVFNDYGTHLKKSKKLIQNTKSKYTIEAMGDLLHTILSDNVKPIPKLLEIKLPPPSKIELPKLKV